MFNGGEKREEARERGKKKIRNHYNINVCIPDWIHTVAPHISKYAHLFQLRNLNNFF